MIQGFGQDFVLPHLIRYEQRCRAERIRPQGAPGTYLVHLLINHNLYIFFVVPGSPMVINDSSQFPTPDAKNVRLRCRCWDPQVYREVMLKQQQEEEQFWIAAGHVADEVEKKFAATISRRLSLPKTVPPQDDIKHETTAPIISIGLNTDRVLDRFQLDDSLIPHLRVLASTVRSGRWEETLCTPDWGLSYEQAAKLADALLLDFTHSNAATAKVCRHMFLVPCLTMPIIA